MLLNIAQIFYCTFVCGLHGMEQICFGPPRCMVTMATCMTSCFTTSHGQNNDNTDNGSPERVNSHETSPYRRLKPASLPPNDSENMQENSDKIDVEMEFLKEATDAVKGIHPKSNDTDERKTVREENIKQWRVVLKAMDALLFILNFLGLTGYFVTILLIHKNMLQV